jgi:hypothetical protein
MPYQINNTSGTQVAIVTDGTIDTQSTSLALIGKNYAGYGNFLNENFVTLLENFSNPTAPLKPLEGQLWYDSFNSVLNVYVNSAWKHIASSTAANSSPTNPNNGDLWFDTTNLQLKVYSASTAGWVTIGPTYGSANGTTGAIVETVLDTVGVNHDLVKFYANDTVVAIISDVTFTPATTISGFSVIQPGINLVSTNVVPNAQITGNAASAASLNGLSSSVFLRNDQSTVLNYTFQANEFDVNSTLKLTTASPVAKITNSDLNGTTEFWVNTAGTQTKVLTVDAASASIILTTPLAVASGGTGATTASAARSNLGLSAIATASTGSKGDVTVSADGSIWTVVQSSVSTPGKIQIATSYEAGVGTDNTKAITPAALSYVLSSGLDIISATTSAAGIVRLATSSETQAGTLGNIAITPAGLNSRTASSTTGGIVRLATVAETITGTDLTTAITPAGLSSRIATETQIGIIQTASAAETTTASPSPTLYKAVTPYTLSQKIATTTTSGIVQLASNAQTQTGTLSNIAVTPQSLLYTLNNTSISLGSALVPSSNSSVNLGGVSSQWWNTVYTTNLYATNQYGTLQTSSQPNVTSLGTLTQLSVTNTIFANATTVSTSSTTGALVVAGGVGIAGDVRIGGNLYVANLIGTTSTILTVQDPLLYLATGNVYPYNYDIGFYSHFVGGPANAYAHTGFVRNDSDGKWYLFSNIAEPQAGQVAVTDPNVIYDPIVTGALTAYGAITPSANLSANIGSTSLFWSNAFVNNLNATNIYGLTQTASQPNITTLGGVTSIGASSSTTLTGTLQTASQTNVTRLGDQTSLVVTGQVYANASTISTGISSGAVVVAGGVGISGNLSLQQTTSVAPLKVAGGTLLSSTVAGTVEYDGSIWYATSNLTNGRGAIPNEQYFRLTANASPIGSSIADYFGSTSSIPLVASGVYDIEFDIYYLKNTAGTVTYTLTSQAVVTNLNAYYYQSNIAGISSGLGTTEGAVTNNTAAAVAMPVTQTLTTAVVHHARIKVMLENASATNFRLQITSSAGTVTPLRGSWYKVTRLSSSNVGLFV